MERGWWKAFFAVLMLSGLTPAASAAPPEQSAWRIWLEPRFLHTPGAVDVPGAHRTQVASGFLDSLGLEALPPDRVEQLGPDFRLHALENAAADLAKVTTEYHRNRQRVIECAEVRSADDLVASAILAPKFLAQFQDTLGPTVLVAIPSRSVAFVFPKLAGSYENYAASVVAAYRGTTWPVSLEIFELSTAGLKAIGSFADPARD